MQFDWTTFILEVLNFLVLVWILKRLFYKPVLGVLDARQAKVQAELDQAAKAQAEGDALKQQYAERLDQWQQEKAQLRAQLETELNQQRSAGLGRLRAELAADEAKAHMRNTAQLAEREAALRREADSSAYANAGKLLQRLATPALTEHIAAIMIEDLANLPPAQQQLLLDAVQSSGAEISAEVVSAHPLSATTQEAISAALTQAAGCTVKLATRTDPGLIAGLRIAVGACLLHANLAEELNFFQRQNEHA